MLTLYLISTMLLILAPGPNMLMMIALASSHGARAGRIAALGLMSGVLVHTVVATTGGSLLFAQWPSGVYAIRLLGSLYLIYMGGRMVWAQLWGQSRAVVGVEVARTPYM